MRVIWSGPARADLRSIDDWLTDNATPGVAVRMLAAVRLRARILVDFPQSGRPHRDDQRVLTINYTPYRITGRIVEVIRIYHERQDWQLDT